MLFYNLKKMPNPVNICELSRVFTDNETKKSLVKVFEYLDPLSKPLHKMEKSYLSKSLAEFFSTQNSLVYQFFAHAVSSKYDLYFKTHKNFYEKLIKQIFNMPLPIAKYTASIIMYHHNCFGRHSDLNSLKLMRKMTDTILKKYKGSFTSPHGTQYNFNIIGTYGRALGKYDKKNTDFFYLIRALEHAKAVNDPKYYLYICKNIGLLGTLIPPRKLLEVIKYIFEDINKDMYIDDKRNYHNFDEKTVKQIQNEICRALAQIRAYYPGEVDSFILNITDDNKFYYSVRQQIPDYDIGSHYSWAGEELFQKILVYHPEFASRIIQILKKRILEKDEKKALSSMLSDLLEFAGDNVN